MIWPIPTAQNHCMVENFEPASHSSNGNGNGNAILAQTQMHLAESPADSQKTSSNPLDWPLDFAESLANSALQQPLNGLLQLAGRPFGVDPEIHVIPEPPKAKFNTASWYVDEAGSALGMALPFIAMHKVMGGTGNLLKISDTADAIADQSTLLRYGLPIMKGGLTGAAYQGLLEPVSNNGNFISARLHNAAVGGITFATLTGTALGLSELSGLKSLQGGTFDWLTDHAVTLGAMSSLPAGAISAEADSVLSGDGPATSQNLLQSAYQYAFAGSALGALDAIDGKFGSARKVTADSSPSPEDQQKGVTLLLTGGAVRGWGHIGVLKYLDEQGVKIDNEYGVSIGGLHASLHTNNYSGQDIQDIFLEEFHNRSVLKTLPGSVKLRTFLRFRDLEPMMKYFTNKYDLEPNDRLHILSYGLKKRQPYEFSGTDYSLPRALRATAGIPGPFRWTRVDSDQPSPDGRVHKMTLLDGGFRKTTAHDLPQGSVVIVSKLDDDPSTEVPDQKKNLGERFYNRAGSMLFRFLDTNHNPDYGTDYVISAGKPGVTSLGFALPDATYLDMVDHGYQQAKQALEGPIARGEIPLITDSDPQPEPQQDAETAAPTTGSKLLSFARRLPTLLSTRNKQS